MSFNVGDRVQIRVRDEWESWTLNKLGFRNLKFKGDVNAKFYTISKVKKDGRWYKLKELSQTGSQDGWFIERWFEPASEQINLNLAVWDRGN